MALGFAAYLLLMKVTHSSVGYGGENNGMSYIIQDDKAGYFSEKWKELPPEQLVEKVLQDVSLWGSDLTKINGFSKAVTARLTMLMTAGAKQTIINMLTDKTVV